jgi:phosphoglucomutase
MAIHPLAGKPAPAEQLINVAELQSAFYELEPDPENPHQRVSFGTSGHRGSSLDASFNEAHILAVTQAICEYRATNGINGPLFLGKDSHALSPPAERTALEVLAANSVETIRQIDDGLTPTPVISRSILEYNGSGSSHRADGIVITPSHNPPRDGGIKYNPPNGGPADTDITGWIEERANDLIRNRLRTVKRVPFERASTAATTHSQDLAAGYIADLGSVVDLAAVRSAGTSIGVDPLGGAAAGYWGRIAEAYTLNLEVVNPRIDPTFSFMTLDHDGKIRMDCSSPYAMASLVALKDRFDIAFGNDPDADRHGIVTRSGGLLNPNHYLAVAISYLLAKREAWPASVSIGKTLVSSNLIDRVTSDSGRRLFEVPVGFKWFVGGLLEGSLCFAGEESAGASFLRKDGTVWTTEKDGIILGLLAAEILARTGKDPAGHYREITERLGTPYYRRIDAPASAEQKNVLKNLKPDDIKTAELAGEPILARLTRAPGNNAPIGGIKVTTANGWVAARPSGTENILKLYAESFRGEAHLDQIIAEAPKVFGVVES